MDKGATTQLAAELERKREQIQSGLADPHEAGKLRPLSDHIAELRQCLSDKSNSTKHVHQTCQRIERLVQGCRFKTWSDINPSRVVNWLALERERQGIGIKKSNYYQAALKEFCTWLIKDGRVPSSPVAHLGAMNSDPDVRWQRRVLTSVEFNRLVEAAMNGPDIRCMTGPDRAMLYVLAAWTGNPRGELASLTVRSFDFTGDLPTVACRAGYSKRRRNDIVPLHAVVVERLTAWIKDGKRRDPYEPLFPLVSAGGTLRRTSMMMRFDLERAGIPYQDEAGL